MPDAGPLAPVRQEGGKAGHLAVALALVVSLAFLAGAVDASGVSILKDLFVSFMSGNTTSLGIAIGQGDVPRLLLISSIVASFVAGAAAGTVLATIAGRHHLPVVIAIVSAILLVPPVFPAAATLSMTFAMGALNAAMDHAGPVAVSITYITGTLVKLGRGLGQLVCGRGQGFGWLQQAVPWLGLLAGATTAALSLARYGRLTFVFLPIFGFALASAAAIVTLVLNDEEAG